MKPKTKTIHGTDIPTLNILPCYANISRAYEIAQVGDHSLSLCYYKSIDGDWSRDVNPKDCAIIAAAYGFTPVLDGDLLIDVTRPEFDLLTCGRKFETQEDLQERIKEAKNRPEVKQVEKYDVCMSLLKTAYERLNLGSHDVQTIFKVAGSIARLDNSLLIRIEHVAEAIQYRSIQKVETTKFYQPAV